MDAEAFAKLAFRETSLGHQRSPAREPRGLVGARSEEPRLHRAGGGELRPSTSWRSCSAPGRAFDLPLARLAGRFERLVLVDIDGAALDETVAATFKDAGLRARVETRVMDLTGINGALVRRLDEILDGPGGADEVEAQVAALCRSYRLEPPPRCCCAEGERPDLLVESCVLTQLAWPQRTYAERRLRPALRRRWARRASCAGRPPGPSWACASSRTTSTRWPARPGRGRLTSDVVSHPTTLDASGAERPTGRQIAPARRGSRCASGSPRPSASAPHAAWRWNRYRPTKRARGLAAWTSRGSSCASPSPPAALAAARIALQRRAVQPHVGRVTGWCQRPELRTEPDVGGQ